MQSCTCYWDSLFWLKKHPHVLFQGDWILILWSWKRRTKRLKLRGQPVVAAEELLCHSNRLYSTGRDTNVQWSGVGQPTQQEDQRRTFLWVSLYFHLFFCFNKFTIVRDFAWKIEVLQREGGSVAGTLSNTFRSGPCVTFRPQSFWASSTSVFRGPCPPLAEAQLTY